MIVLAENTREGCLCSLPSWDVLEKLEQVKVVLQQLWLAPCFAAKNVLAMIMPAVPVLKEASKAEFGLRRRWFLIPGDSEHGASRGFSKAPRCAGA